jgi:membrane-associated phospholipid phosphatase
VSAPVSAGERWGHALRNVLRFCAFGATLLALVLARATSSPLVVAGTVLASLALLVLVERNRRLVAVWSAYVGGFVLFAELRALADETGLAVRYDYVVEADEALFGGVVPTVWLQEQLGNPALLSWVMFAVYTSYYFVPHAVALVVARRSRDAFRRYAIAVMAVVYTGLAISALVPTAPPWLAASEGRIDPVTRIVPELTGNADENLYDQGAQLVGLNPVAAFPSLHTALTVLLVLLAWRAGVARRGLALGYSAAMGFALVYLGEHYVIDVAAGAVLAVAAWAAVLAAERRHSGRAAPQPAPGSVATARST